MDPKFGTNSSHYKKCQIEVIEVIEDWHLPYHLGAVLKYIARYKFKHRKREHQIEDLKKADDFLTRYIQVLELEKLKETK